jgi:hypothetical protein
MQYTSASMDANEADDENVLERKTLYLPPSTRLSNVIRSDPARILTKP